MNKLNKEEQKEVDKILKMTGKTLIQTMIYIGAENFLTCNFVDDETKDTYHLRIEKIKE